MQAPWWWSKTETCSSDIYVYFNLNFNVFFLNCICWRVNSTCIKMHGATMNIKHLSTLFRSSGTVTLILVQVWRNWNFLARLSKNSQISNFTKVCPMGAELFHADGQTDRHDEANSCFSKICEGVKGTREMWTEDNKEILTRRIFTSHFRLLFWLIYFGLQ